MLGPPKELTTDDYELQDAGSIRFASQIVRKAGQRRLTARQVIQACALVLVDAAVSAKGDRDELVKMIEEAWRRCEAANKPKEGAQA